MPTVLRHGPYRFFFYSAAGGEPPHIHVERDRAKAKFWLEPIVFHSSSGFGARELLDIRRLVAEHQASFLEAWHDYFDD